MKRRTLSESSSAPSDKKARADNIAQPILCNPSLNRDTISYSQIKTNHFERVSIPTNVKVSFSININDIEFTGEQYETKCFCIFLSAKFATTTHLAINNMKLNFSLEQSSQNVADISEIVDTVHESFYLINKSSQKVTCSYKLNFYDNKIPIVSSVADIIISHIPQGSVLTNNFNHLNCDHNLIILNNIITPKSFTKFETAYDFFNKKSQADQEALFNRRYEKKTGDYYPKDKDVTDSKSSIFEAIGYFKKIKLEVTDRLKTLTSNNQENNGSTDTFITDLYDFIGQGEESGDINDAQALKNYHQLLNRVNPLDYLPALTKISEQWCVAGEYNFGGSFLSVWFKMVADAIANDLGRFLSAVGNVAPYGDNEESYKQYIGSEFHRCASFVINAINEFVLEQYKGNKEIYDKYFRYTVFRILKNEEQDFVVVNDKTKQPEGLLHGVISEAKVMDGTIHLNPLIKPAGYRKPDVIVIVPYTFGQKLLVDLNISIGESSQDIGNTDREKVEPDILLVYDWKYFAQESAIEAGLKFLTYSPRAYYKCLDTGAYIDDNNGIDYRYLNMLEKISGYLDKCKLKI